MWRGRPPKKESHLTQKLKMKTTLQLDLKHSTTNNASDYISSPFFLLINTRTCTSNPLTPAFFAQPCTRHVTVNVVRQASHLHGRALTTNAQRTLPYRPLLQAEL